MSLLRRSRSSTHNQIHVRKHVFKCWNFKDTHKSNALLHIQNVRWRFFLLIPINSFRMKLFEMKAHKIIYSSRFGNVVHCFQEFIYKQYCVPVWNEMKWIGPFAIPFDSIVCFFVSFFFFGWRLYLNVCLCLCLFIYLIWFISVANWCNITQTLEMENRTRNNLNNHGCQIISTYLLYKLHIENLIRIFF